MHDAKTVKSGADAIGGKYISLLLSMAVLTARAATAQISLQASDAQVTAAGNLQYSLTSSATRPATAWSVTVVVADPNGTVIRQSAITLDEYRAEAQRGIVSENEMARSLLRPRQTRRFELPGPFDPRLVLTVTPVAMVFLDGTSIGDPLLIESIFHRRAAEREARGEMLQQLLDVRTHYVGPAALQEAIARLSPASGPRAARASDRRDLRGTCESRDRRVTSSTSALGRGGLLMMAQMLLELVSNRLAKLRF